MYSSDRRNFLKNATMGSLAAVSIPHIAMAAVSSTALKKLSLKKNSIILFQGDSITDAGRKRDIGQPNSGSALGNGYAFLAAATLLYKNADKELKIFNKGISGNKVYQLAERWEKDCLSLKPDVLSVLIGVNDYWHTLNNNYKSTVKTYKDDYDKLLARTKDYLPDVQLVIGEPFAVPGIKAVDDKWFPSFDDYRAAAKEIADKYHAIFIPYQSVFNKAKKNGPGAYWTYDGVHPTVAGAQLMASAWLQCVK